MLRDFFFLVSKVDLQDRGFLTALANHAQALAKIILRRSNSGQHLAEDAQVDRIIFHFLALVYFVFLDGYHRKYSKS